MFSSLVLGGVDMDDDEGSRAVDSTRADCTTYKSATVIAA